MKKGFTLIELLVVISIIGLLSTIVLASLASTRGRSRDTAVKETAIQLRNVYELEYLKSNSYAALMPAVAVGSGYICTANTCLVTTSVGCTGFYGAGSEGEKICKDVFNEGTSLSFGIIGGSVSTDYAFFIPYVTDNSTGVCIRSNGTTVNVANVTVCTTKSGW